MEVTVSNSENKVSRTAHLDIVLRGWGSHWWTGEGGRAGAQVRRQRKAPVGSVSGRAEDGHS